MEKISSNRRRILIVLQAMEEVKVIPIINILLLRVNYDMILFYLAKIASIDQLLQ